MKRKIRRRDRIWTRQKEYRLTNRKISEKKVFKSKKMKIDNAESWEEGI